MKEIKRRQFIQHTALASAAFLTAGIPASQNNNMKKSIIQFRLLRHATMLVEVNGNKILVDPMLSKKDEMEPVPNAANTIRIPMVDLPLNENELAHLLNEVDAVLVTHLHRDHWDVAAQQQINKSKLLFCQPGDETKMKEQGFTSVQVVDKSWTWNDIKIHRTRGQHGTGEIGKLMGTVSGFIIEYQKQRIYIAGDTIWCDDVKEAIANHQPTHIIVNGGGAQFLKGDPITMTTNDVVALAQFTKAKITVVHLESVNHCYQRRPDFKDAAIKNNLTDRINIPADGEWTII